MVLSTQPNAQTDIFPGFAIGERIPLNNMIDYITLSQTKDWRCKLDNSWSKAPFKLDNHTWASVDHYYNASKFKKGYPDFYIQFSLDSDSDLSKDSALANIVGSKEKHPLKPKHVKIDPDFYGGRSSVEKELALQAKVNSNIDIRNLLLSTRSAKITRYKRGADSLVSHDIMQIRDSLLSE